MEGRAPWRVRASVWFQSFWVVALLTFAALTIVFIADYWMEFRQDREMFFWRLGSFFGLSIFVGWLALIFTVLRTHRWHIENQTLYLRYWGELSGEYRRVTFRVQTQTNENALLKAIFDNGGEAILAAGTTEAMLKLCHYMKEAMKRR